MFKIFVRAKILDNDGNILLVTKNNKQRIAPGKTLLPGGTLEYGEEPIETIIREVKEETNLKVIETELYNTRTIILEDAHRLGLYYNCKVVDYNINNNEPEKHSNVFWGTEKDLNG